MRTYSFVRRSWVAAVRACMQGAGRNTYSSLNSLRRTSIRASTSIVHIVRRSCLTAHSYLAPKAASSPSGRPRLSIVRHALPRPLSQDRILALRMPRIHLHGRRGRRTRIDVRTYVMRTWWQLAAQTIRTLPPPPPKKIYSVSCTSAGRFLAIGCALCHVLVRRGRPTRIDVRAWWQLAAKTIQTLSPST